SKTYLSQHKKRLEWSIQGGRVYIKDLTTLFEPLMTKIARFLGIEHTCKRISLLTAVSLIYQAIPVVPTVFDDWI
ncbi:hypothetical protein, partial [Enterococcus sp. 5B3_DIV0040]|uniref:hypothetical protein n=1 Tax=Enterococcus sp. 5B3_DIV0040 TaxID=1834182 RepID=UPI001C394579